MAVNPYTRVALNEFGPGSALSAAYTEAVLEASQVGAGDNNFANGGVELVVLRNAGATPRLCTFSGVDYKGDAQSQAITLGNNSTAVIGPFPVRFFGETVTVVVAHAAVEVVVVTPAKRGGATNTA